MSFDLIRRDRRNGETTAEMTIREGMDGGLLKKTRLNRLSMRSRSEVANPLRGRRPGPDWATLLEMAAYLLVDADRVGRPAVRLRDAPDESDDEATLLPPLLAAADRNIFYGDGGAAKSLLGLVIAPSLRRP